MVKSVKVLFASFVVLVFVGCGSSDARNAELPFGSNNIEFPTNAVESDATVENAQKVKEVVAKNQQSSLGRTSTDKVDKNSVVYNLKKLNDMLRDTKVLPSALNEAVDNTSECSDGGTMKVVGDINPGANSTMTIIYNQCKIAGFSVDGQVVEKLSEFDSDNNNYKNMDLKFLTDITMISDDLYMKISKGSSLLTNIMSFDDNGNIKKMKLTIDSITQVNAEKSGQDGSVYIFENLDNNFLSMYQTEGRIYINNLESFVDYDTSYDMSQTPLVFDEYGVLQDGGEARYNMSSGGKMKIVVENSTPKVYVDANGDGTYDLSE